MIRIGAIPEISASKRRDAERMRGPIANRPQVANLPHTYSRVIISDGTSHQKALRPEARLATEGVTAGRC
jgi:hypothetical protein